MFGTSSFSLPSNNCISSWSSLPEGDDVDFLILFSDKHLGDGKSVAPFCDIDDDDDDDDDDCWFGSTLLLILVIVNWKFLMIKLKWIEHSELWHNWFK